MTVDKYIELLIYDDRRVVVFYVSNQVQHSPWLATVSILISGQDAPTIALSGLQE
jgi:hypothetical protein